MDCKTDPHLLPSSDSHASSQTVASHTASSCSLRTRSLSWSQTYWTASLGGSEMEAAPACYSPGRAVHRTKAPREAVLGSCSTCRGCSSVSGTIWTCCSCFCSGAVFRKPRSSGPLLSLLDLQCQLMTSFVPALRQWKICDSWLTGRARRLLLFPELARTGARVCWSVGRMEGRGTGRSPLSSPLAHCTSLSASERAGSRPIQLGSLG